MALHPANLWGFEHQRLAVFLSLVGLSVSRNSGVNLGLSRNMEMLINCWISRRYVYNTVCDVSSLRSESVWRYFSRQRFGGVIYFLWSSVRLVQPCPDHDTSTISYYHVLDLRSHTG